MTYRGLTWDHPRGRHALEVLAARVNATRSTPLIHWDVQTLEGFESAPIADLAKNYDLLVLDHPHIGEAVAEQCLSPLEMHFPPETLAAWGRQSVGPAYHSYRWMDQSWAFPLDVATQVMALQPDRLADIPVSWDEIETIAHQRGVAQSLAGPHALLTLMSMVAGEGGVIGGDTLFDAELGCRMLERMHRLYALRPRGCEALNPIELLEAMSRGADISLIPLVFGYVNYARAATGRRALRFTDTLRKAQGRGGVLGGTGIALTSHANPNADLLSYLTDLMSDRTQIEFIPAHEGQPSARAAWTDASVNAAWGHFYANTLATAERALLRPRFDGYVAFQTQASCTIRDALEYGNSCELTLDTIETAWTQAQAAARQTSETKRTDL